MHGNGNDFIIIDETEKVAIKNKSSFAIKACDRRFGIGADGVLFVSRPAGVDLGMHCFSLTVLRRRCVETAFVVLSCTPSMPGM